MIGLVKKIQKSIDSNGYKRTKKMVVEKLKTRVLGAVYLKEQEYIITWDLNEKRNFRLKQNLKMEFIDEALLVQVELPSGPKNIQTKWKNYLKNDFKGIIVRKEEAIVGYIWWFEQNIAKKQYHPSVEVNGVSLEPGDVYMFDNRVFDEFKGNANATEMLYQAREVILAAGYQQAKAIVRTNNLPAKWLYSIHGWKYGRVSTKHIFFKNFMFAGGKFFIRNGQNSAVHNFDFRLVYPKRRMLD